MRSPDCVLVRLGEIALKSPQVQRRMFGILLNNMRLVLEGFEYRMETNPNRIFIYTKQIREAAERLKKIFGVTSLSPAWTCFSGLNDIRMLASDIASDVLKLTEKNSFAIRAHRVGRHKFSSKEIAEESGAAVKRVTGARVDLSNPGKQIFIETRSRKTYVFVEKIPAVGGMPLGSSGKIIAVIETPADAAAAWLTMKRGCEVIVITDDKNIGLAEKLKEWDRQTRLLIYEKNILENFLLNFSDNEKKPAKKLALIRLASLAAEKENALGISSGTTSDTGLNFIQQMNEASGVPVYLPLLLYTEKELKRLMKFIGLKVKLEEEKIIAGAGKTDSVKIGEISEQMFKSLKNKGTSDALINPMQP